MPDPQTFIPADEESTTWFDEAKCIGLGWLYDRTWPREVTEDPVLDHPPDPSAVNLAKRLCQSCPVRVLCLTDALDRGEEWGVFGGLDAGERRALEDIADLLPPEALA